jgi:hypothetical protein
MTTDRPRTSPPVLKKRQQRDSAHELQRPFSVADMKVRQATKIREIGSALVGAGIVTLDEQARTLGLSRSTAWTILKGSHKGSGLSATTINRMLASPRLPPLVRAKIREYVEEKTAGLYGDDRICLRRFSASLTIKDAGSPGGDLEVGPSRARKIA